MSSDVLAQDKKQVSKLLGVAVSDLQCRRQRIPDDCTGDCEVFGAVYTFLVGPRTSVRVLADLTCRMLAMDETDHRCSAA